MTSAVEEYGKRQEEIAILLDRIQTKLEEHERRARQDPGNWSLAGNLDHVHSQLVEIVVFLR